MFLHLLWLSILVTGKFPQQISYLNAVYRFILTTKLHLFKIMAIHIFHTGLTVILLVLKAVYRYRSICHRIENITKNN